MFEYMFQYIFQLFVLSVHSYFNNYEFRLRLIIASLCFIYVSFTSNYSLHLYIVLSRFNTFQDKKQKKKDEKAKTDETDDSKNKVDKVSKIPVKKLTV